jgi:hypothetical protein
MSFIDTYIEKNRIGDISQANRQNLAKLEKRLLDTVTKKAKNGLSFLDAIKNYEEEIVDLIGRVRQHFAGWKFTLSKAFSSFRFVSSIAIEVYQIINVMQDEIIPEGVTGDAAWRIKRDFGKSLIYFIWKTIGPLDKQYNWVPFKKTIERRLVLWLAGIGIDTARSMFEANNKEVSNFSDNNKAVSIKAL